EALVTGQVELADAAAEVVDARSEALADDRAGLAPRLAFGGIGSGRDRGRIVAALRFLSARALARSGLLLRSGAEKLRRAEIGQANGKEEGRKPQTALIEFHRRLSSPPSRGAPGEDRSHRGGKDGSGRSAARRASPHEARRSARCRPPCSESTTGGTDTRSRAAATTSTSRRGSGTAGCCGASRTGASNREHRSSLPFAMTRLGATHRPAR